MAEAPLKESVKYICVLDFEATCDVGVGYDHEVIEFPSVLLEFCNKQKQYIEISRFDKFCQPLMKPKISSYCNLLTGITQAQVNAGHNFPDVLKQHSEWLQNKTSEDLDDPKNLVILTCGFWDLGTMMIMECKKWDLVPPRVYRRFFNIKDCYVKQYKLDNAIPARNERLGLGMAAMLKEQEILLAGRHHSGIDDCGNIASLVCKMNTDGFVFDLSHIRDVSANEYNYNHQKNVCMAWAWNRLIRLNPNRPELIPMQDYPKLRPAKNRCHFCNRAPGGYHILCDKSGNPNWDKVVEICIICLKTVEKN